MAGGEVQWHQGVPAPALRRFVAGYTGYRLEDIEPMLHRGIPSRNMTWIVAIGPTIDVVEQPDASLSPASFRSVVGGLQERPALIAEAGTSSGVAIELTPLGSRALFGVPARALWNGAFELADVVGPVGDELWERLQPAMTWPERFATCDDVLGRLVAGHDVDSPVDTELAVAWGSLVASDGMASIGDLADTVGWSRQHLRRRFVDEFGLAPKVAGRIMRFQRAVKTLRSVPSYVSIAQVAATCGYYDQAHLHRDFVQFAGCSPSRWLAEELVPSVQDDVEPSR